jgi:hypothetical protein
MFYRTIAPRIQVDRLLRIAYNDLQADYDEGFTTGGNAAPPTACGSPVTGAVLRPRVDRPIPIALAEVPRFPRNDPLAAASTAHQSKRPQEEPRGVTSPGAYGHSLEEWC